METVVPQLVQSKALTSVQGSPVSVHPACPCVWPATLLLIALPANPSLLGIIPQTPVILTAHPFPIVSSATTMAPCFA